ncbi:hypothetical protein F7Q99_36790 [Streptomyces kaniharaensis]|uniref:Uncharacterized protein n=1 Tax=Streptomyces kaniharaensis TaxID=212423 RepID=A0A6N7L437_9ACTN|nr:hypothetical protein [Streptomyces kaniharaensis]MQS17599.1 hypothetical protein [Streptomyces kaniharaensis]
MADLSKHQPEAQPVFDPALPAVTRDAVAELAAHHPDLLAPGSGAGGLMASYSGAAQILRRSAATAAGGGIAALGAFILGRLLAPPADVPGPAGGIDVLVRGLLSQCENAGLIVFAGGASMAIVAVLLTWWENRYIDRALDEARGHYVHPHWLTNDAAPGWLHP